MNCCSSITLSQLNATSIHNSILGKIREYGSILIDKIKKVATVIFEHFLWIVSVPTRYMGSKSWSLPGILIRFPYVGIKHLLHKNLPNTFAEELFGTGYHRFGHSTLTKQELKPFLKYACMAASVHSSDPDWVKLFGYTLISPKEMSLPGLPQSVEARENCFFNPRTGLKMALYQKDDQLLIGFGVITGGDSEAVNDADKKRLRDSLLNVAIANIAGIQPSLFDDANELFLLVKEHQKIRDKKITLVGQCFGASLTSYLALQHQIKGICMNPLPIGVGVQYKLGSDRLMQADKYLTHICAKGDYTSDQPLPLNILDTFVNFIGFRTPGNFGKKVHIPSAYEKGWDTHRFMIGSMMAYLGYNNRIHPSDLDLQEFI